MGDGAGDDGEDLRGLVLHSDTRTSLFLRFYKSKPFLFYYPKAYSFSRRMNSVRVNPAWFKMASKVPFGRVLRLGTITKFLRPCLSPW